MSLAATALLTVGLSACSGGDDAGSSYTALETDGGASTGLPTSTSTASRTPSSPATTPSSTTTSATPSTTSTTTTASPTSTATTPAYDTKLASACINATGKMNSVVRQWNNATRTKSTSQLNEAANAMSTTATSLRTIGRNSGDNTFAGHTTDVARELDNMNEARDDGKSVLTDDYNTQARQLRSYCKTEIGE
ncbi:hypothetical protein VV01_17145 [Luteipulveratus halotolerans]|uniref:Uncharacterized protein n=2 Tax=Luteipulveratus halotolerans TaxID=1631356 RepID=A0A0L6CL96_9MICO|nr:hypothetical protein VV01_17145 [Luteipulveratus halotolerans]